MNNKILIVLLAFVCVSCSDIHYEDIKISKHNITHLCMKQRGRFVSKDIKHYLKESFMRHRISTEKYNKRSKDCAYRLSYYVRSKRNSLKNIQLSIYLKKDLIAFAGSDMLNDSSKIKSKSSFIDSIVDKLLDDVRPFKSSNKLELYSDS